MVESWHTRHTNAIFILSGDFNEVISRTSQGKVATALKHGHPWAFLMIPYALGAPTNFVQRGGRLSKKEIDYILVNASSDLAVQSKCVYPGVSSHGAVCCTFTLPHSFSYVKNSAMKATTIPQRLPLTAVSALITCFPFLLAAWPLVEHRRMLTRLS